MARAFYRMLSMQEPLRQNRIRVPRPNPTDAVLRQPVRRTFHNDMLSASSLLMSRCTSSVTQIPHVGPRIAYGNRERGEKSEPMSTDVKFGRPSASSCVVGAVASALSRSHIWWPIQLGDLLQAGGTVQGLRDSNHGNIWRNRLAFATCGNQILVLLNAASGCTR